MCACVVCVCGAVYVTGLSRSSSIYNFKQYMYYNILGTNLIYIGGGGDGGMGSIVAFLKYIL